MWIVAVLGILRRVFHGLELRPQEKCPAVEALSFTKTAGSSCRRIWRRGVPSRGMGAMRSQVQAWRVAARGGPRRRSLAALGIVATVVAMWVLVVGGHSELRSELSASHSAHALVSSLGGEFTVNVDHAHLSNAPSAAHHHEAFATGVLPVAPVTAVAALSVVVLAVAVVGLLWRQVMAAGRSPPRGVPAVLTGQELLTRLSLSRR